ncbi:hypothetical protein T02_4300 [Trichinella nativa]|uniref:Uncharacterized protein n=1 Tax=Trichinella nativa TaxID=6335 RepID=A0A0V1KJW5_9BILA|nr:hypothetical protein T02_4300 [Trichinella nativa]
MAAAPMSKLNFASQTNGSICTTVNTNHMKNFQTNFCIQKFQDSCRNPPIAMLLRKAMPCDGKSGNV